MRVCAFVGSASWSRVAETRVGASCGRGTGRVRAPYGDAAQNAARASRVPRGSGCCAVLRGSLGDSAEPTDRGESRAEAEHVANDDRIANAARKVDPADDEVSPKMFIRLVSLAWLAFAFYALAFPLRLPVAVRLLEAASEGIKAAEAVAASGAAAASAAAAPLASVVLPGARSAEPMTALELTSKLIEGIVRLLFGALSFLGSSVLSGFRPTMLQASEASAALMAMAFTQLPVFKSLSKPALALAASQFLGGMYFSGVSSSIGAKTGEANPNDLMASFKKAFEQSEDAAGKSASGNGAPPSLKESFSNFMKKTSESLKPENAKEQPEKPPKSAAQSVAGGLSFVLVIAGIAMLFAPLKTLAFVLRPSVYSVVERNEMLQTKLTEAIRTSLSVMVIACGRVLAAVDDSAESTARTARGLYLLGGMLIALSRGLFGMFPVLSRTPGTIAGIFCLWNALNFSAFSAQARFGGPSSAADAMVNAAAKRAAEIDAQSAGRASSKSSNSAPSGGVIDVEASEDDTQTQKDSPR